MAPVQLHPRSRQKNAANKEKSASLNGPRKRRGKKVSADNVNTYHY